MCTGTYSTVLGHRHASACVTMQIFTTLCFKALEGIGSYICVVFSWKSKWHHVSSPSENPLRPLPWLLTSAALLAAIVIAAGVCMCNYVKGGKEKSMPQQLVRLFFPDCPLVCLGHNKETLPYRKVRHIWHTEYCIPHQGAYVTQQPESN